MQDQTVTLDPLLINKVENKIDDYDIFHEMSRIELYEAIDRLGKPRERLALLGELTGKSAETIAMEMGCTVSAVYKLIKKAKLAVAKIMKGNEQ